MSRLLIATSLTLAALGAMPALAQPAPPPAALPPSISVFGEAQVSVPPDVARIEAGVAIVAKTAHAAADANHAAMGKVLSELKNVGIESKDIQTSRLSLHPQYASSRPGPSEITGYLASNLVSVKVRDIAKVANVVDTLVGAGANEIRGIAFIVSDASKRLDEARSQAIADARRKAEIYARAAGVTLGGPLSISEETHPNAMPLRKMATGFTASAAVAPGEETLGVTVMVNWSIKPQ